MVFVATVFLWARFYRRLMLQERRAWRAIGLALRFLPAWVGYALSRAEAPPFSLGLCRKHHKEAQQILLGNGLASRAGFRCKKCASNEEWVAPRREPPTNEWERATSDLRCEALIPVLAPFV